MKSQQLNNPITRAGLGITALILIVFLSNWLISLTSFGTKGADFTEDKIHTLSSGTKNILSKLDAPVTIRYYASRKTEALPRETKLFIKRVDDLLKEYVQLSNGRLRVENLDPQPDTDAEDSASLDGIQTQNIAQYENAALGLAISCLDQTTRINIDPFDVNALDDQETMFEYNISRSISEVSAVAKPVLAIMSPLSLKAAPAMMPGHPPQQGWVMYQQLSQTYKVKDLDMSATEIPSEVKVLMLVHPAGITEATEFAIDQFVLKGGTLVACLDPYSFEAAQSGGGNPMMRSAGITTSSTLPKLLSAWKINFESSRSLADGKYRTMLRGNQPGYAILSLPKESLVDRENVITKNINDLFFVLTGGFTNQGNNGLNVTSLVRSSDQAGFVNSEQAAQFSPNLVIEDRRQYDLVLHLNGKFKTAFPDGDPSQKKDDTKKEDKDASKEKPSEALKEASSVGNVFLIADTDAFSNQGAYRIQNLGGMQAAMPYNGNSALLLNVIDQAASSSDLIGARSRASSRRPFTLIREMEARAEQKVGDEIASYRKEEEAAGQRLSELQMQKSNSKDLYASPEQEAEIKKLRQQQVEFARKIRDKQKDLKRDKDQLTANLTLLNLAVVPTFILLAGIGVATSRRKNVRAR